MTVTTARVGLHRGAGHVIEMMPPSLEDLAGGGLEGLPAAESMVIPPDVLDAMDRVYDRGIAEAVSTRRFGTVTVLPWRQGKFLVGVSTHWEGVGKTAN